MTKTIETLRGQHQTVLARLDRIEAVAPPDAARMEEFLTFLKTDLKEHLELEEGALFPVLSHHPHLANGPVAVMEAEHRECDALAAELAVAVRMGRIAAAASVVRQIIAVLRAHIDKEDHVLFPLAGRMLSAAERQEIDARAAAGRRSTAELKSARRGAAARM